MTIDPFYANSNDQAIQTLVRELNNMRDTVNAYAAANDALIASIVTDDAEVIVSQFCIAVVNYDYDLTYNNQGQVTVDG